MVCKMRIYNSATSNFRFDENATFYSSSWGGEDLGVVPASEVHEKEPQIEVPRGVVGEDYSIVFSKELVNGGGGGVMLVSSVEVIYLGEGTVYLTIFINYLNKGASAVSLDYAKCRLRDSDGNIYTGKRNNWLLEDSVDYQKVRGDFRSTFNLLDGAQPGVLAQNFVGFDIPRTAFNGDLVLGFSSNIDDRLEGEILIYDGKTSTYDFEEWTRFKSSTWK